MGLFSFWHPELKNQQCFAENYAELDDMLLAYTLDQDQVEKLTGLPVEQAVNLWKEVLEGRFGPEAQKAFQLEEKVKDIFVRAEEHFRNHRTEQWA